MSRQCRSKFELIQLGLAHKKYGVWTRPKFSYDPDSQPADTGAPNDSFLLNTLSRVLKLEVHPKRRHKICISSVILGQLESFRNYKGLSIIFPKILDAIWRVTKVRHFLIPLSIVFLNSKILGFFFSTKNSLNLGSEMRKIKLAKIVENLLHELEKLYMNGTVI